MNDKLDMLVVFHVIRIQCRFLQNGLTIADLFKVGKTSELRESLMMLVMVGIDKIQTNQ